VRVLVITNLYPPHAMGGYELSCHDTVERWRGAGHDVSVLTTTTTFHDPSADPPEPDVRRVLEWYWADHHIQRPPRRERFRIERDNQRRLSDVLAATRPEVVSLWAMGGMSMGLVTTCLERGLPVVAVIEDDWLVYAAHVDAWTGAWLRRPRWLGAVARRLTGLPTAVPVLPAGATVAFASEYLRRRAEAEATVHFTTSAIVPLGTDPVDFPSRRPGDRPWRGRLLMVGRVEPRKGFDIAIQALADLPDATLRIVGAGDDRHRRELIAMARDLGVADRLTCDDFVARRDLAAVYAESDALLFLSRWDEPFGLVPLEAMTQAVPVVAIRRGGAAEFLSHGLNCLEVPVDDPSAVSAAVRALASDDGLRRRLVNAGLTTSAAYRVDRFAGELEAIHLAAAQGTT
jgi:glycosyltransferase involved in cell wall biosynthesis